MKTIFEQLKEKNVCYSVIVSLITNNLTSIEGSKKEYSIIIHRKDLEKLKGLGFYANRDYKFVIYERDLDNNEVLKFKEIIEDFVKVQHDKDGKVYELKNNSFKKMYDSLKYQINK
jgi:hypothetical protein